MHTICTYLYTDTWNVLSFTLAKADKGRACPPVMFNIAFTSHLIPLLLFKWRT